MRSFLTAAVLAVSVGAIGSAFGQVPAFPGAEGFGAMSVGGRGGSVYEVTTLEDSGPGSLREGLKEGNRTIIFRVGGTIELKSRLNVSVAKLTIAGQTAPGGGICIKNYTLNLTGQDLVVRFLRVRLGDEAKQESDGLTIGNGSKNVIVDHCSVGWSVDEALSTAGKNQNITVQWCIIAEALKRSLHAKGDHGYGSLARANGPVTWHHNLWAHNDARNPRLGDDYGRGDSPQFDVRNNVMYDWGNVCSGLTQGKFTANYVGNYIKAGPSSNTKQPPIRMGGPSDISFYFEGNVVEGKPSLTSANAGLIDKLEIEEKPVARVVEKPFDTAPVKTTSAEVAYEEVLAYAGAVLPKRDSADARLVGEVKAGTGKMINSPSEVGGWPVLEGGVAPADSDHDGMPDEWEAKSGLNPKNAADGAKDADGDGYTNLEECLNGTDPKVKVDYTDPKNNVDVLVRRGS